MNFRVILLTQSFIKNILHVQINEQKHKNASTIKSSNL